MKFIEIQPSCPNSSVKIRCFSRSFSFTVGFWVFSELSISLYKRQTIIVVNTVFRLEKDEKVLTNFADQRLQKFITAHFHPSHFNSARIAWRARRQQIVDDHVGIFSRRSASSLKVSRCLNESNRAHQCVANHKTYIGARISQIRWEQLIGFVIIMRFSI